MMVNPRFNLLTQFQARRESKPFIITIFSPTPRGTETLTSPASPRMNSGLMKPAAANPFPLSLLGALVFFLVLWALDFPKPMNDNLFYCGAGLNLAQGGDLANPLLARQEFPGHYFFIYPPVHSYLLSGWLKLFGISAVSMTGFVISLYFICAAAIIIFLRRHAVPTWLEWSVPLAVGAAFLVFGYRLPAGALNWEFSAPFPQQTATDTTLLPGDVYLLGPLSADLFSQKGFGSATPEMWTPLPLLRWGFYQHPRDAYILRGADCVAKKTVAAAPKSLH
jgi:hypothetical protein